MFELFQAAITPHQILLSLLLVLVVLYWLLVILGALDFETDLPDDLSDGDADVSHGHGVNTGGAWLTAGRFFGFSQVPIVVWMSFMILFMWFISLALNELWNAEASTGQALLLILPNLLLSAISTKLVTIPVAKLFKAMADADTEAEEVIGRTGIVCSIEADERYGQLEINARGVPLLINVRTRPGEPTLPKGTPARVTEAGPDHVWYFIEPLQS
ncbi:hypothetical protein [Brevifollis gellanilyticus]|uniref:DUF1449 domain-containing protein n=1 Tax=Brevifollis gellanilyticus TaxID=748831 RepID=A0A512M5B4_9BACT|nr:hypothetical protein [Brevifollis gellanilyticus]GEP41918.1 hypothetical protein BGE01nite_12090 [Brevifollis gellanilyticus]